MPHVLEYIKLIDQTFDELEHLLDSGADIVLPLPAYEGVVKCLDEYLLDGHEQIIFHNIGTGIAALPAHLLLYIQHKIGKLSEKAGNIVIGNYYCDINKTNPTNVSPITTLTNTQNNNNTIKQNNVVLNEIQTQISNTLNAANCKDLEQYYDVILTKFDVNICEQNRVFIEDIIDELYNKVQQKPISISTKEQQQQIDQKLQQLRMEKITNYKEIIMQHFDNDFITNNQKCIDDKIVELQLMHENEQKAIVTDIQINKMDKINHQSSVISYGSAISRNDNQQKLVKLNYQQIYNHIPDGALVITTDDASKQNSGPAGSGGIIELGKNARNYIKFAAAIGRQLNNVAELYVIGLALKILIEDKNIAPKINAISDINNTENI